MLADKLFIQTAIAELNSPSLPITRQYLSAMEVKKQKGEFHIARVNKADDCIEVYFTISNERFFLVLAVRAEPHLHVSHVWVESGHRVYLTATSTDLSYKELAELLSFQTLDGWSKGDYRRSGSRYEFSRINFEPNKCEAYELEEKLNELLNILCKHSKAVINLSKQANAYISVCKHQYVSGNAGIHFDSETIAKLQQLNLPLDIDTYITGKEIADS